MISKLFQSPAAALTDVRDGATVMIGGFGGAGQPNELIDALIVQGARDLVIVNNNAGNGETGLAALLKAGRGGADKNLDWFYAASPRLTRYSIGLREPREILIRFSLYQRMYESTASMNCSMVAFFQSRG